jgi:hypothetical protein
MHVKGTLSPLLPVACRRSALLGKCSAVLKGVAQVSPKVRSWVEGHLHSTCCLTDGLYLLMLSCLLHVGIVPCFCSVYLCSEWRIQQIAGCPLVNAARLLGLLLLCYFGIESGTLHIEYICGPMATSLEPSIAAFACSMRNFLGLGQMPSGAPIILCNCQDRPTKPAHDHGMVCKARSKGVMMRHNLLFEAWCRVS